MGVDFSQLITNTDDVPISSIGFGEHGYGFRVLVESHPWNGNQCRSCENLWYIFNVSV